MTDAYRKVGRGGAGNFYSPKDVEDVEKAAQARADADPEAQKAAVSPTAAADEPPSDPAQHPSSTPSSSSTARHPYSTASYARTGRGGAGNFVDPVVAAAAQIVTTHAQPRPATVHTTGNQSFAASSSSAAARRDHPSLTTTTTTTGYSGRGGAGNWTADDSQHAYEEEADRKRRAALDAKVVDAVTAGLPSPIRAHTRYNPHRGPVAGSGTFEEM